MSWNPDEWQKQCMILASRYHGVGILQEIPDSHGGDCGLEGFSTDETAVGYQCYVPEENAKTPLTTRLIQKINDSTLQMKNREKLLSGILAGVKLKRWYLLIPREFMRDNKVVSHAGETRTKEVTSWNLSFIAADFRIVVGYGAEFEGILKALGEQFGRKRIQLPSDQVDADVTSKWEAENAAEIPELDHKLSKTGRPPSALAGVKYELIRCAVIAQNSVDKIRLEDPEGWEKVLLAKSDKANALRQECALTDLVPAAFLTKVMTDYTETLKESMPTLSAEAARILSNHAIVEWLMACPLDFHTTAR
jgi:hypothetical protein